jgi:hypothetical protein
MQGAAALSACGRYRWWLERVWEPGAPRLLFVGLNPSGADARRDDPTLRRLLGFARGWGYGALEVVNLFSRRCSSPALLHRCADPVGNETDAWIVCRAAAVLAAARPGPAAPPGAGAAGWDPLIWLGWGNGGTLAGRERLVGALLEKVIVEARVAAPLAVIGWTAAGQPRHPLYAPKSLTLQPLAAS